MIITALSENTTARASMVTEHGLSLYIQTATRTLLIDMGQGDVFARNAQTLGVDLRCVDTAVVSHGHYDHGGGLAQFLRLNDRAPVYLHRDALSAYYNATHRYIGLSPALAGHPRLHTVDNSADLGDGITLLSMNNATRQHIAGTGGLLRKEGDAYVDDDFRHELYCVIEEHGKRIVISGCSHKGIVNIVEWLRPDVIIGGFHLAKMAPDDMDLDEIAALLSRYDTTYYTCHCTGTDITARLQQTMSQLHYLACGDTVVI